MYKPKIYLFFTLLTLFSCTKSDYELVGTYKTHTPSFFEKVSNTLKYGKWTWTMGNELSLNKDSTFVMTTCGNISKGKWYANTGTIFLTYQESHYRIDSLNYIKEWKEKLLVKEKTIVYRKQGENLETDFKDKKKIVLIQLDKVKSVENQ
jgi:hypothetical protein